MKATDKKQAWEMVSEIFPTDYTENTTKTKNAGYPIFDSNLGDEFGYICDLGNRLEVNLASGKVINVWIEEEAEPKADFENFSHNKQMEIAELFRCWLSQYSQEVISKALERKDEIINNTFAMNLLKELKQREAEEQKDMLSSMYFLLSTTNEHTKHYDIHNHCLTHSKSYRDVLYDMYIKNIVIGE